MSSLTAVLLLGASVGVQAALAVPLGRLLRRLGASLGVAGWLTAGFIAAGVALRLLFWGFGLELDRHQEVLWAGVCSLSVMVGLGGAARTRRLPGVELAVAAALAYEAAVIYALLATSMGGGVADPPLRALLVAPAALLLCSYFGASVGYLLMSGGELDGKLGYEALIGRRFLLSKSSPVLSTVTAISVVGVALGVALVIFALGVLGGFEGDLQEKIIGANAHVILQKPNATAFELDDGAIEAVRGVEGVQAAAPYIEGEVALASQSNYTGGLLFGIDPARSPAVLSVLTELRRGSLAPLVDEMRPAPPRPELPEFDDEHGFPPPAPIPSIVIGREMANALNVTVGDTVRVISPLLETLTPMGPLPKSLGFRVAAVFSIDMYEFDARFAYTSLAGARRFFELDDSEVSGMQLKVDDPERSDVVGARALAAAGAHVPGVELEALDWKQRNQTLFAALKLERVVAFVVLVFIILVAAFSIVTTLTMSVIEKRKEIAILKTMGARDVGVMKVFLVQGMLVGTFGTFIGAALAVCLALILQRFGFGIPGEVYYIDSLPVHVGAGDVVLVVLAALLILWDFSVFPALRASRLEPVEGLRDG